MRLRPLAVLTALVASLALAGPALASPANDDFASAEVLTGLADASSAQTETATVEDEEPMLYGGTHSVWFRWTAPAAGAVTADTLGADFDTVLGVYAGPAVGALTAIQDSDDLDPNATLDSRVRFLATAGATYAIRLDGNDGGFGTAPLHLSLDTTPDPPVNDAFAAAIALPPGPSADLLYDTSLTTSEPGEPDHGHLQTSHSAWYRWTPSSTGGTRLTLCGDRFRHRTVAVYTGSAVNALTPVVRGDNDAGGGEVDWCSEVVFVAQAGTSYSIALDGREDDWGTGRLTLYESTSPPQTFVTAPPEHTGPDVEITFDGLYGLGQECRLDDAPDWTPCVSPLQLVGLAPGAHALAVREVDGYGWADPTPAVATWTVDGTVAVVDPDDPDDHPELLPPAAGPKPRTPPAGATQSVPSSAARGAGTLLAASTGAAATHRPALTPLRATLNAAATTRAHALRRRALTVTLTCAPACTGTVRVVLGRTVLARVRVADLRGPHRIAVRLGAAALAAIRKAEAGGAVVRVTGAVHDLAGRGAAPATKLTLR